MQIAENRQRCFIALVTFEKNGDRTKILAPEAKGASGWIGVMTNDGDEVERLLRQSLFEIGLRLVEVSKVLEIWDSGEVVEFDKHLAANIQKWQTGQKWQIGQNTVWGAIHPYYADGKGKRHNVRFWLRRLKNYFLANGTQN